MHQIRTQLNGSLRQSLTCVLTIKSHTTNFGIFFKIVFSDGETKWRSQQDRDGRVNRGHIGLWPCSTQKKVKMKIICTITADVKPPKFHNLNSKPGLLSLKLGNALDYWSFIKNFYITNVTKVLFTSKFVLSNQKAVPNSSHSESYGREFFYLMPLDLSSRQRGYAEYIK